MHCFAQRPVSPLPARPTVASHELSNDGLFAVSVRQAEQLKSQLTQAVDNGKMADVARIIVEIEEANLTKEALEVSRIAAIVNALRKKIADKHPSISRKCRALIKLWQLTVDAARSTSSAGSSSCNGTPSLISPALRRGTTPRSKTVTPNGNPLLNGIGGNSSYAPSNISPQLAAAKRKHASSSNASPDGVGAKKSKLSPSNISPPAAVTNSVIAARRNVQSTEQLVAALGMENLLASSIEKKTIETTNQTNGTNKVLPIQVPTIDNEQTAGRRKRQPKTEAAPTPMPRIKIVFGKRASGEMETKIEEVQPTPEVTPSSDAAKSESSSDETTDGSEATNNTTAPKKPKPAFSWYDKLPSIEELEKRIRDPPSVITERPSSPTDMMKCRFRDRSLILMPYIDSDEPDFVTYEFPTPSAVAPTPKADSYRNVHFDWTYHINSTGSQRVLLGYSHRTNASFSQELTISHTFRCVIKLSIEVMERQRMLPTTDQQTADPGVLACINHLEQRLCEIKSTIRDLLVLLEQQERVNYPELLHNLFLLAESFSNIQEKIKKVLAPGGGAFDENWTSLQTHLLVPNAVDMNESTQLLKETENRLTSWNHEVVPDYLRTQLAPRVLEQERSMEKEGQLSGSGEQLSKKVSTFNKNVDTITGDPFRLTVPPTAVDAQSSAILQEELQRFVRAIMKGEGVRPKTGTLKK